MPATINAAPPSLKTFNTAMAFSHYGAAGSGTLFLDAAGKTYIGATTLGPAGAGHLKPTLVGGGGGLHRMVEGMVSWPLRLAPEDHTVTFQNKA